MMTDESNLKDKVIKGSFWVLLERCGSQVATFLVGLVLARLLTPTDYGQVAMIGLFVTIATVLVDGGFGSALIQKKDADELDFNSVFYLSLGVAAVLYLVLFFAAPLIASFYGVPSLVPMIRVVSLTVFSAAINTIQNAEISRRMLFHYLFRMTMISTTVSLPTGLALAWFGFGPWSLVWSWVAGSVSNVIVRWYYIAWRPRLAFSFERVVPLFRYSWKLLAAWIIGAGFQNLYKLLIGKFYTPADLSFVEKGRNIPELVMNNVSGALASTSFPALVKLQNDRERMREAMRKMLITSTFIVFPMMLLLAVVSPKLTLFLYGEKWMPSVPFARLACFSCALMPFAMINERAVEALGRSDLYLKIEILKKTISVVVLGVFLPQGVVFWMAAMAFVEGPFGCLVNAWPQRKLLGYSLLMQLKDVAPVLLLTVVVAAPLLVLDLIWTGTSPISLFFCLACQGVLAVVLYLLLSIVFKMRGIAEVVSIIGPKVKCLAPLWNLVLGHCHKHEG